MDRTLKLIALASALIAVVVAGVLAFNASTPANADEPPTAPGTGGSQTAVVKELAPIEEADLRIAESFPPQYFLHVKYGLSNGCVKPAGYDVDRNGNDINVSVWVTKPSGPVACTMIYGIGEHNIALGSDFQSGQSYTITLNGAPFKTFVAQ